VRLQRERIRVKFGVTWIPAPTSIISGEDSYTVTRWPLRVRASAAARPVVKD
jgi:hypothetical protein